MIKTVKYPSLEWIELVSQGCHLHDPRRSSTHAPAVAGPLLAVPGRADRDRDARSVPGIVITIILDDGGSWLQRFTVRCSACHRLYRTIYSVIATCPRCGEPSPLYKKMGVDGQRQAG